ncbi:hypothetical protein WMF18_25275 [Sorangium sp. So ce315]|uniref:hypothetical protein n=1 Tax=Sorangium sp. So ce315 TaxID=3133299 RepID=UPI003F6253B3
MNSERSGGTFLLQETEPKRLLGCLISTTTDTGPGWVQGSFSDEPGSLTFVNVGNKTELVMSRGVALSLVSLLQVLVAQNAYIRSPDARWTCGPVEPGRITVSHQPGNNNIIIASWVPDPEYITCRVAQDDIEWRIREDMAMELALGVVCRLAQIAAGVDTRSI